jgi:hypothetical protein
MNPSSWAVAADIPMSTVKLLAAGVPVSETGLGGASIVGTAAGEITGRMLATLTGLISDVLTGSGVVGMGPIVGTRPTAGIVLGEATGEGVLVGDLLAAGVLAAAVGALTVTVSIAVGSSVMAGLVAASAVAVNVTDVTELAPEATWICACIWYAVGDTAVASDPIVHVADPFPPGQRLVNSGSSPCGSPVSVTETPEAGPFSVETCTV